MWQLTGQLDGSEAKSDEQLAEDHQRTAEQKEEGQKTNEAAGSSESDKKASRFRRIENPWYKHPSEWYASSKEQAQVRVGVGAENAITVELRKTGIYSAYRKYVQRHNLRLPLIYHGDTKIPDDVEESKKDEKN